MKDNNQPKKHGIAVLLALIAVGFFAALILWAGEQS